MFKCVLFFYFVVFCCDSVCVHTKWVGNVHGLHEKWQYVRCVSLLSPAIPFTPSHISLRPCPFLFISLRLPFCCSVFTAVCTAEWARKFVGTHQTWIFFWKGIFSLSFPCSRLTFFPFPSLELLSPLFPFFSSMLFTFFFTFPISYKPHLAFSRWKR